MTVLWTGARVLGPDGRETGTRAFATDGEWIIWAGRELGGAPRAERNERLGGRFVSPGFVDGHAHLAMTGLVASGVDLSRATSVTSVRRTLARFIDRDTSRFVWGAGWDDASPGWRGRGPSGSDLDRVAGDRFTYLTRVDGHSAVVSTRLFEAAGCARHEGADRNDDGRFSGVVRRDAHHAARDYMFRNVPASMLARAHEHAARAAASTGITTVHEMGGPVHGGGERGLDILLGQRAGLPVDVVTYYATDDAQIPLARGLGVIGGDVNVDGSLGSRTAALRRPYADARGHTGSLYRDVAVCAEFFESATRSALQAGVHCIGEAACEAAVRGLERAARKTSLAAVRRLRHRLEHFEMANKDLIARAARLGAAISMQPAFDAAWGGDGRMYAARVGRGRARGMNHFRAVVAAGGVCGFGSDSPVTPFDPLGGIRTATDPSVASHAVAAEVAWRCATTGAAALAREERIKGRIAVGYRADFVVWERDPRRLDGRGRVAATVRGNRLVHGAL